MSIRLKIASRASKLLFKPAITHIKNLKWMRYYLDFVTKMNAINPKGAVYEKAVLMHKGKTVPAVWASLDTPSKSHVLFYIHGGGFIFGSADTHKHMVADIAGQLGIKAVLPNYRLAPENPYPAGFDDVVTSYQALLEMGYKAKNIIIGGDSAGGCLAFALLAYIKANDLPMPACTFTFASLTDMDMRSESLVGNARSDCVLSHGRFDNLLDAYASGADLKSPYISPIHGNFTGAGPVLLQAAKGEMLLDDSKTMYKHLTEQGVDARLSLFDNSFHVFQMLRGVVPEANQAITEVVDFIRPHISKS